MKYCKYCGAELADDANVCSKCGHALVGDNGEIQELKKNKMAIAGFVLAIVSMVVNLYTIPAILGLVFSIVGLVQIKKGGFKNKGLAIAGLIISIVALVWDILYYAVIGPAMSAWLESIMQGLTQ